MLISKAVVTIGAMFYSEISHSKTSVWHSMNINHEHLHCCGAGVVLHTLYGGKIFVVKIFRLQVIHCIYVAIHKLLPAY